MEKVSLDHNYNKPVKEAVPEKSARKETESQAVLRIANSKSTQTVLRSQSTQSTQTEDSVKSCRIYSEAEIKKGSLLLSTSPKAYNPLRTFGDGRYPDPRTIRRHIPVLLRLK